MKKYGAEEKINMKSRNKGITLMALVVTVIVLLILATITISTISGNSIITRTMNAKEQAEINSEIKVIGTASNQAKNMNKYGDLEEEQFVNALNSNTGKGKTTVKYYEKQKMFSVTFRNSSRTYQVFTNGNVKYLGKLGNAIIISADPSGSISLRERYDVNITIERISDDDSVQNNISSIKRLWTESEEEPQAEEFTADDNNSVNMITPNGQSEKVKTTKSPITLENGKDGKTEGTYYLHIQVTKEDGEIVTETFGPYELGIAEVQLAVDPNGGKWRESTNIQKVDGKENETVEIQDPQPQQKFTVKFDTGASVEANVTFVEWNLKDYGTITKPQDGKSIYTFGTGAGKIIAQYTVEGIELPNANKEGNEIEGWYKGNTPVGKPGEIYVPTYNKDGEETLTAKWKVNKYEVTYDYSTNGGTKINYIDEQSARFVEYGKKVDLTKATAVKDGYTFLGWNTNKDATTAQTSDITMTTEGVKVYAIFQKQITLTFKDAQGEKHGVPHPVTIWNNNKGSATAPKISEYDGWTLRYWTTSEEPNGIETVASEGTISNIEKNTNYYARYTKQITVSFNLNGGTGANTLANQTGNIEVNSKDLDNIKGASIKMPNVTPTKEGYEFNGWNTKSDGTGTHVDKDKSGEFKGDTTLYAEWVENTYKVAYYQGNNSETEGTTKISGMPDSSHTYGTASKLTAYAGTAPSGWTFAGWSTTETGTAVSTVNSVSLTDGASVTNLTNTANGTVKLYAIFKRNIVFKSGASAGTTDATKEQRYNPYKTTGYLTSVTSPSALTTITGWTKTGTGIGYRNDATAETATLALNTAVTPAYNETNLTYYGVYTKVINVYSGVSKGTNNKQTQYLNTNGNKVSSISLAVPTAIENWTAIGYRDDTTAGDKETAVTTSAVSVTPAYSTSAISYYAVYSRTLTIKYNGNEATSGSTSSTTKTVYLNTNSTTTSSQQVTLANNGFIKNGYMFSKWAKGSTSGTKYSEGASYTAGLAYNASSFEVTMYAIWQDVYLRTSESSVTGTTAKFLYTTIERRKIKSITFANSISGHTVDGTICFDVSSITNSKQVLLWITNTDSNGYYDIVIGQNGGVKANPNSSYLFSYVGYTPSTFTINFTNFINTANVTNMSYMFQCCGYTGMTSLNLGSNFDTSSVTDMSYMFKYCGNTAMTSLNLGDNFNTSNVTNMTEMFKSCGCEAMTSLDLGNNFDTSKATNMNTMFYDCGSEAMKSLNLGNKFNTSNVTDMSWMFGNCGYKAMTSLDLGDKFDTSNVTNMSYMFASCGYTAMASLDLGDKFDTSSVTDMSYMFDSCGSTAMTSLDLGDKFDTSSVTNMQYMFNSCPNLVTIYATDSFVTTSVTNGTAMFTGDTKLVGGMGTTFSSSHTDHAYAHVDEGTTNPGYFTNKNTYYVEFDANGGTGTMARQVMTYGEASNLSTNAFAKEGYGFAGWNDKADGSGTSYTDGQSVLNLEAGLFKVKKLYAQWQKVTLRKSEEANSPMTEFLGTTLQRGNIKKISFANSIEGHTVDGTTCFDVSSIENSGQALLWITNTDENGYYDIVIGQNGGVIANPDSSYLFSYVGYDTPLTINFTNFDTSNVTGMGSMFNYCGYTAMTSLDLGDNFDTSSVTNMEAMFRYCGRTAMTSLDLGDKFDTSSVTDMSYMFSGCGSTAMTSLYLGDKFDTSKVTDMSRMFYFCGEKAMTSLDLGDNFDTSNVTNMRSMFSSCGVTAMTSLNLGDKFDTSSVTDMSYMFQDCGYTAMASLDLGDKFDTSSVTDMRSMFSCCGSTAMTSLDLGDKFDTSNVTNMRSMFSSCGYTAMTSLDLGDNFDTSNVTNMRSMFSYCGYKAMTGLNLGDKFNTSNVTDMYSMFSECGNTAMTSLDLGDNFDTSNVTNMRSMFSSCGSTAMTSLNLGDKFDTSKVTDMSYMFSGCGYYSMTSLDLGDNFDTSSVTDMRSMFSSCGYTAVTSLDLGDKFDTSSVTDMSWMFGDCGYKAMTSLDLGDKFDTSSVTDMSYMFSGCGSTAMTSLYLGDKFDTSNVTNMASMFAYCSNLVTIYATESFVTTNVTNGVNMFSYDTKLVGGMGTVYNSSHTDHAYAHVDEGTTNPGYFTDKNT